VAANQRLGVGQRWCFVASPYSARFQALKSRLVGGVIFWFYPGFVGFQGGCYFCPPICPPTSRFRSDCGACSHQNSNLSGYVMLSAHCYLISRPNEASLVAKHSVSQTVVSSFNLIKADENG
jgi:hypothetical protein